MDERSNLFYGVGRFYSYFYVFLFLSNGFWNFINYQNFLRKNKSQVIKVYEAFFGCYFLFKDESIFDDFYWNFKNLFSEK